MKRSRRFIDYERQKQKEYFTLDSPPLWYLGDDVIEDSSKVQDSVEVKKFVIIEGVHSDIENLILFVKSSIQPVVAQLVLILLVFVFLLYTHMKWGEVHLHLESIVELQVKTILSNQFSAALIIGILVSSFFYDSVVPVFSEIQIFLVLSASTYLLPRLTTKKMVGFMALILLAFILQSLEPYFEIRSHSIKANIIVERPDFDSCYLYR